MNLTYAKMVSTDLQPRRDETPAGSAFELPASMPLVLDLDGTLIAGDLLYESFFSAIEQNPLIVFACLKWLSRGRAALKRELALRSQINWENVRLHQEVLALALREKSAGRSVILATAADALLAKQLASRLAFIDQVVASNGEHNLKGDAKANLLKRMYPEGFIYAGDSKADLSVWPHARAIVLVNARPSIREAVLALGRPTLELSGRTAA
jgi:hypothetical protein